MRIVYILTSLGIGGAERQVVGLAERMTVRGHQVALLVLKPCQTDEWSTTVETHYLNITKSPFSILQGICRAHRFLNNFSPEIIHSHTFPANIFARMIQLLSPSAVLISTIHNVYEGGWQRMLAYQMTDFLSHQTTAVSRAAADRFIRLKAVPAVKCTVISNGIEACEPVSDNGATELRAALGAKNAFVWLAAGRVVPAKDYENLLRAFAQLHSKIANTDLWIAGAHDTDEGRRVRTIADQLGIGGRVRWLGLRRDMPQLFTAADGFVLSSAWEGMPLVLGEAMAATKPVVATDVGGVRELVGNTGTLVPAKDSDALADAMYNIQTKSAETRETQGREARERIVTEFSMESRATTWEDFYRAANQPEIRNNVVKQKTNQRYLLWGALFAAALVRLLLLCVTLLRTGTSVITSGDTESYLEPGRRLILLGQFSSATGPEIDRTPGYPIFLALTTLPGEVYAVLVQIILAVISVYIVARIARRVFIHHNHAHQIAIVAAWLFALEPVSIIYSIRLLPETLFVLLFLLSIDSIISFLENKRLSTLAVSGLWLAAATYVRPVSYYLPILLAGGLLCGLMCKPQLRWQAPLVLLAVTIPLLGAWQIRNVYETGFAGFSSIVQRNLYFYQAAEVTARIEHRPFADVQNMLGYSDEQSYRRMHPEQALWTAGQRAVYQQQQAMQVLWAHPWVYLQAHLTGSAVVAFTPCAADLFRLLGAYPQDYPKRIVNAGPIKSAAQIVSTHLGIAFAMVCMEVWLLALYVLAIGTVLRRAIRPAIVAFLLGAIVYFIVVSGGGQAVGRYRLPIMPLICVLAAYGWQKAISERCCEGLNK